MNTYNTHNISILYVEDDPALAFVTKDNLEQFGYKIIHYENGQQAISNFTFHKFDLCILDIMLPKMDGYELAKRIRDINQEIPILFLSAKSEIDDKIKGLKLGADDYITKPFSIEELRLKVEVFLKRNKITEPEQIEEILIAGSYTLDVKNQMLKSGNLEKKLTLRETTLLKLFFNNQNILLKREEILKKIWGDDGYFSGRSMDVFMSRTRKYLSEDKNLQIENVRSIGFRLVVKS